MSAALGFSPSPADPEPGIRRLGQPPDPATDVSILHDHSACCVSEAIASGNEAEQRAKFSELADLFEKVQR